MSSRTGAFMLLILLFFHICSVSALTNTLDSSALSGLKSEWTSSPDGWEGSDPCGTNWVGIKCRNDRVISISLGNLNLEGKLPADISFLSELEILDLSYNTGLSGPLPPNIGNLKNLKSLILVGCSFSGEIPESIGSLKELIYLSLNLNKFSGTIPASIGRLSKLYWFDIADNQIEGELPVSNGTSSPGLDMLLATKHFHFGKNKLSGKIPKELFSSNMTLIHVLLDGNQFTGEIPESLGLVNTLTVLRLDRNRLIGEIPSSLNNLTSLNELYLANNKFTGSLPNLTALTNLYTLDVSNNTLDFSPIPSWISSLRSLSTLRMEGIQLTGPIPSFLFSATQLQTAILKRNQINETLDFGTDFSNQLEFVDLQYNDISEYIQPTKKELQVILANNPVCLEAGNGPSYCSAIQHNTSFSTLPTNCSPCEQGMEASTTCRCAQPFMGTLYFRSPSFSGLFNSTNFLILQKAITDFFKKYNYPVDSVGVRNIRENETDHQLLIDLLVFPLGRESFNQTGMSLVGFAFSNQTYKPPPIFGPYIFKAALYKKFSDVEEGSKSANMGIIIGAVVGAIVLLLLLTIAGVYALRQKKRAERATDQNNPFAKWDTSKSSIGAPQLMGAKAYTFEELKKCTDNFSEANDVGGGGYGKVYRGILPNGQLIAIKRAQQGSLQGGLEFKTEIELLSRVHHKNVVRLLGFCFDRSEQMLVYEYISNGSLKDSLSGKSGIRLDWTRRLKIALGSGKGLAYLHELADPPIIHRDIKSNNILLDENLTAKVADFGLSKLVGDPEKTHVTTQVKGTMGYLDPEYYMTNQLTEKSDVYGFGVMMLELLTGEIPIVNGKYVVKEVKMKMNKSKKLYDLQELLDTTIISTNENLNGFEKFVDLALICVDQEGVKRPSMNEVVKEIEYIMQHAGLYPNVDSAASSRTYDEASKGSGDLYRNNSFEYSASFPTTKLEPH
ncbi:PREDICTED: probable leucine-rich repeat receptor-like protein kinase At5g49770 isoform X1 [Camelina sativa]|uniref:Probable leucine-rich repeat receptor-like protein kinase At5g49770 isoform X1 n=1 Tax=Camelina sativa TaxID=90675 RepID=A0ABM1RA50_CAMSA|nr:PREDICTED: probable leucine-rich repeat receptor-like protein kinase At5g49770 isoform X1 [Camelina sativa]